MKRFLAIAAIVTAFLAIAPLEAGPAPSPLSASTRHLKFTAAVGGTDSQTVDFTNTSSDPITINTTIALFPPFFFGKSDCFTSLGAGATCSVQIDFTPTVAGEFDGKFAIGSSTGLTSKQVSLTGIAT